MANFLTNLVQRFNQQASAVQARPVSLFEPQTQFDLSPWAGVDQTGDASAPPSPAPRTNLPSSRDFAHHPVEVPMQRSAIEPQSQNIPKSPREKLPALETEGQSPQLGYLVVRGKQQKGFSRRQVEPITEADTAPSERFTGLELERAAEPEAESRHQNQPAPSHQQATPSKTGIPTLQPIQPRNRVHPLGQASIQPQIERKAASSPAEPVINVTIGRVEVVATPPKTSTPPPKTKRPSPVMSLDEYLKNRDQERPR